MGFSTLGGTGSGGGLLIPDSATVPFATTAARDTWAAANKSDLIKDTTAVNVTGASWFVWRGETNPDSYDNSLWVDGDQIVKGEKGEKGDTGNAGDPTALIDDSQELADKTYSSKKIGELLVEGTGFPDHGTISDLNENYGTFFDAKPEGKYYLDGWEDSTGLPTDIPLNQRVMAVTNFNGYDGNDNGARVVFSSHLYGVYEGVKTSGLWGELKKLDNPKVNGAYVSAIDTGDGLETEVAGNSVSIRQTMKKSVWEVYQVDSAVPIEIDSPDDLGIDYRYTLNEIEHVLILKMTVYLIMVKLRFHAN